MQGINKKLGHAQLPHPFLVVGDRQALMCAMESCLGSPLFWDLTNDSTFAVCVHSKAI